MSSNSMSAKKMSAKTSLGRLTLNNISAGQSVRIVSVTDGVAGRRLVEMGVYPGRTVCMLRSAPLRDPIEFQVGCCRLSLRSAEAALVLVEGL